jgi:Rps23 Pro-64 3,4-dihydroxylase Tpa1-like proline 4-hydroxylase
MVLDKERLLKEGYLSFNIKDLDESLYNELYNNFDKEIQFNIIDSLRYDGSIDLDDFPVGIDDIDFYFQNIIKEYELSEGSKFNYNIYEQNNKKYLYLSPRIVGSFDSLKKIENILKKISSIISQTWYFKTLVSESATLNNIVSKIYQKSIMALYSDYISDYEMYIKNILRGNTLTLYVKNNFIEPHSDGYVDGRLCVILIYLNDDYKNEFGGELVIDNKNIIEPIFGNIAILDFTKNNILHSVNPVIDDNFKRFAFINFFNKD